MLAIIVLGAVAGALLGSHFKMFVLGPAILLASFAAVAAGFTSHFDAHTIVLGALATLAALQFGYVVGGVAAAYLDAKPNGHIAPGRRRNIINLFASARSFVGPTFEFNALRRNLNRYR